jgi:uncharacterized protein (DUF952 family)
MTRPTLHMVPATFWAGRNPVASYLPAAYPADGFIHCTDGDQAMVATANRFYREDSQEFLVLTVDLDATGSPWQFDDAERRYPHIYGPIDPTAVLEIRRMVRDADGTFTGIAPRD